MTLSIELWIDRMLWQPLRDNIPVRRRTMPSS